MKICERNIKLKIFIVLDNEFSFRNNYFELFDNSKV